MTIDHAERVPLGRTGLEVTRLAFGGASIGGLFKWVEDEDAVATVRHAWSLGVRYFDTAPLYGYGASERRMGRALADRPRDGFVLSTKVGRLVRDASAIQPGADIDRQRLDGREDAYYVVREPVRMVFDYSADGVRRSLEESLERLGLERIDIALIHDPDEHWAEAIDGAWPALERLRAEGVIRAVGAGMNQSAMLTRFVRETTMDVVLVAGRYTLLDQSGLGDLLPACLERGVAVLVGGVMNSGVLADPRAGARFDYAPAPGDVIERARRIGEVCARHDIPLRAAAMQFPIAHPAVASLVAGVRSINHLDEYPALLGHAIPADLWSELRHEGLIASDAPVPVS
ncbi:MAG TPA: aldo/keto reductase [Candidatus Limnocylindrales bacterium]|jgi:D-threo-aldose 1-dehydrogenase|nr:aldo/keto reductase [Candidatus Limnocylindrales bacterium]